MSNNCIAQVLSGLTHSLCSDKFIDAVVQLLSFLSVLFSKNLQSITNLLMNNARLIEYRLRQEHIPTITTATQPNTINL